MQTFSRKLLEDGSKEASVDGPLRILRSVSMDPLPIMLAHASVEIDLVKLQEALSLPQISDSPEQQYHREGEVSLEEVLCGAKLAGEGRSDGYEELSGQRNEDECQSDIGTCHTKDVLEGNVVERSALSMPCLSEADVSLGRVRCVIRLKLEVRTRQMEPHVKRAARPDNARSQSKTILPLEAMTT